MNQILTSESLSYINLILSKRSSDTDETDSKLENPMFKQGFVILVICVSVLSYLYRETKETKSELTADVELEKGDNDTTFESNVRDLEKVLFNKFKWNYLLVYSLVICSDWLQGAYVYALYSAYGYDVQEIAILFVAGFLSSAVFGTMFGSVADKFGRKLMCLSFCIIYIGSCLTKLSDVFTILMIGRITGGIATSLLFSVFEAWMVSEFYSRGFNEELLSDIFSWQTFLNGLVAIVSGVFANTIVDFFGKGASGYVAPFMAAIVVLCISFFVISTTWKENYGKESTGNLPSSSGNSSMMDSFRVIKNDFTIFAIGSMQCFFEGAMYTFVFMWSPSLEAVNGENETLPFGIIFASFMVSIMLGSVLFRISLQNGYTHESIARSVFFAAFLIFFACVVFIDNQFLLFVFFNMFEVLCGLYFPSVGTIRGKFVPEETRATVMNIFRIPLNLIVVGLLLRMMSFTTVFGICSTLNLLGFYYAHRLYVLGKDGKLVSSHNKAGTSH